jgi:5-(carboxyamino)imidazole ribonucleotide synthase
MSAHAAQRLGFKVTILDPDPECPASQVTPFFVQGQHIDPDALYQLARHCDIITLEHEWVDPEQLSIIEEKGREIYPSSKTLSLIVDKYIQRQSFCAAGIPGPECEPLYSVEKTTELARQWGFPVVLKARHGGYDGYGVRIARSPEELLREWPSDFQNWCVEEFIDFDRELAVMAARGRDGKTAVYPVVESIQTIDGHRCDTVCAPAPGLGEEETERAKSIAIRAIEAVDGIGLFGIELFHTKDGRILINEMAPRPHNSGHYTMDCCVTSQFEQHIRSICGLRLGPTDLLSGGAAMANLLGSKTGDFSSTSGVARALTAVPQSHIHWYGKSKTRKGRKMGHVNVLGSSPDEALKTALIAREAFWRE